MNYYKQQSARLIYRKFEDSDIQSWTEFFVDNANLLYLGVPENLSLNEKSQHWLNVQFERYQQACYGGLAAICQQTGKLIGTAGLSQKMINEQIEYEVSYSIKPQFWRQGYGIEVASTMKEYAIKNKIHPRVISIVHQDNIGSKKVALKNGMSELFKVEYKAMPCVVYGVDI